MRSLPLPPLGALGVFVTCASCVRDPALATRLMGVHSDIEVAERLYVDLGRRGQLYTFPANDLVGDWVEGAEMETLYTGTLVRQGSEARRFYDALRASSPHGLCPYCAQRTVGTLDHYLPKTSQPVLAVTPANLVPACADCNTAKLDFQPAIAEEQILHPYFDDVTAHVWLKARMNDIDGRPVVDFLVDAPDALDLVLKARLLSHLRLLGLATLYAAHAAEELVNTRDSLQRLRLSGGPDAVRSHCEEQVRSRRAVHANSWQAAYYDALARSDWFCDVGVMAVEVSVAQWPADPTADARALVAMSA